MTHQEIPLAQAVSLSDDPNTTIRYNGTAIALIRPHKANSGLFYLTDYSGRMVTARGAEMVKVQTA